MSFSWVTKHQKMKRDREETEAWQAIGNFVGSLVKRSRKGVSPRHNILIKNDILQRLNGASPNKIVQGSRGLK